MREIKDFYEAYHFLSEHPIVLWNNTNYFNNCLNIEVVKINPDTNQVDENSSKNTKTQIWLEFGGITETNMFDDIRIIPEHNINLDCGGFTFEEAIIKLANLVIKEYPKYKLYDKN